MRKPRIIHNTVKRQKTRARKKLASIRKFLQNERNMDTLKTMAALASAGAAWYGYTRATRPKRKATNGRRRANRYMNGAGI